jgi:hypothetical protein
LFHHRHRLFFDGLRLGPDVLAMTRLLAPYLIGAAVFAAIIGATAVWFVQADRDRRELDSLRDYQEGTQDADQATDDVRRVGSCQWVCDTFGGPCNCADGPDAAVD